MFDSGILNYYELTNIAENGRMPQEKLVLKGSCYYDEQTVGVTRAYAAMSANQRIDKYILCHNVTMEPSVEYVILEDGLQYRISLKQIDGDDANLTLERLGEKYDVAE